MIRRSVSHKMLLGGFGVKVSWNCVASLNRCELIMDWLKRERRNILGRQFIHGYCPFRNVPHWTDFKDFFNSCFSVTRTAASFARPLINAFNLPNIFCSACRNKTRPPLCAERRGCKVRLAFALCPRNQYGGECSDHFRCEWKKCRLCSISSVLTVERNWYIVTRGVAGILEKCKKDWPIWTFNKSFNRLTINEGTFESGEFVNHRYINFRWFFQISIYNRKVN